VALSGSVATSAAAEFSTGLVPPASSVAQAIHDLHSLVLWICLGIFAAVFLPMFYAIWRHRRSLGHEARPFHEHRLLEIVWTAIPAAILLVLAFPATKVVLAMKDTSASDITIEVTGLQWKWQYEYLGQDVKFTSNLATSQVQIANEAPKSRHYLLEVDRPLVVPTGRKIRLVFTAADVIHSWWVPALGVKQDAIPGFLRDAWFTVDRPGTYRGQCTELCGIGHGFMPIVVEAVPPAQYAIWIEEQKTQLAAARSAGGMTLPLSNLVAQGEKVFATNCAACHQANGRGIPGAFPALDGSRIVNGPKAAHLNRVFNGKPGTAMPAFGKQLSDLEIAAVISYERNSWHNRTGDGVQPAEVAALRASQGK
jgi:cytochrome c oxidase subunit 2